MHPSGDVPLVALQTVRAPEPGYEGASETRKNENPVPHRKERRRERGVCCLPEYVTEEDHGTVGRYVYDVDGPKQHCPRGKTGLFM